MKKSQRFVKTLQKLAAGIAAAGCAAAAFAAPADGGWFAPLPAVLPAPQHADHGADNFYKSTRLNSENVNFRTQFDTTVSGVLFTPRTMRPGEKLPAIVVGHPMGAVKEQSAALYAQKMAEQGFVTLAIDLPFWGSSSGTPRNSVLPDLYSEAFMAAVDFLGTRSFVEREKIGGIGICGSGSF
ncbi:MAG: alpha/beta hydrolase, partial [Mesosutterella sp.]|nr:alpha/beta hydrolase [Mesosutterella sp.]